jgi:hypothetical protein
MQVIAPVLALAGLLAAIAWGGLSELRDGRIERHEFPALGIVLLLCVAVVAWAGLTRPSWAVWMGG